MKRVPHHVELYVGERLTGSAVAYAANSARQAGESLLRDYSADAGIRGGWTVGPWDEIQHGRQFTYTHEATGTVATLRVRRGVAS